MKPFENKPKKSTPLTWTFTAEEAERLADQVIADKSAGGRETLMAVMLKRLAEEVQAK
jgi:hypothetical protein